jgi:hypothetical protein
MIPSRIRLTAWTFLVALPGVCAAATHEQAQLALERAHTAYESAQQADAARDAPAAMNTARNMLTAADGASQRRNWTDAWLNAEKATADANLASARSRQMRAEAATAEIEASLETVRAQLGLPTGVPQ